MDSLSDDLLHIETVATKFNFPEFLGGHGWSTWGRLRYNLKFEAYELDTDDDELKRAPSFRADKDFDWGDRSQEAELHRYYGIPPYWGGF